MYNDIELITAIITPFTTEDTIDYPALDALTDKLLAEGTQGFVIGGTTGESPTLTHAEKL
ncbi:dihydrodipicolinate synthase family protein, partial [Weissella soli]